MDVSASFCHVNKIRPVFNVALGTQKWNGDSPSFMIRAIVSIFDAVRLNIFVIVDTLTKVNNTYDIRRKSCISSISDIFPTNPCPSFHYDFSSVCVQFSSVQSLSRVQLFVTP